MIHKETCSLRLPVLPERAAVLFCLILGGLVQNVERNSPFVFWLHQTCAAPAVGGRVFLPLHVLVWQAARAANKTNTLPQRRGNARSYISLADSGIALDEHPQHS